MDGETEWVRVLIEEREIIKNNTLRIEKEILNAIKIEKKIQNDESEVETTVDTIQDSFNSLEKFVKKLFKEYREGF